MTDDSTIDTLEHIQTVQRYMRTAIDNLIARAGRHDFSKLVPPEKAAYDMLTPRLAATTYGSEAYTAGLAEAQPAIQHHYQQNDHHPEHHPNGIAGMSLLSLLEMLCDWRAASLRHNDGTFMASLAHNQTRWGISDELMTILRTTASELGFIEPKQEECDHDQDCVS